MGWIGNTFLPTVEEVFEPGEVITISELVRRLSNRGYKEEARFASHMDDAQLEDLIQFLPRQDDHD